MRHQLKLFTALTFCLTFNGPSTHCSGQTLRDSSMARSDLSRAMYMYHRVWTLYRVSQYGLFSEYYPAKEDTTVTYLQGPSGHVNKVSYLWPLSGLFFATNALMEFKKERKQYQPYLDSMAMAFEKYRDTTRKPAGYQAYPPVLQKADRYYDDNGLVSLAYTHAYLNTHRGVYLQRAEEAFRFILSGWSFSLGGGVYWVEGAHDQKPACSNGMAALAALWLYEATRNTYYLEWGKRFYDWMHDHLRDSSGLYWNDEKTKNGSINKTYWTYNSGSMLHASVLLYRFTGKTSYLDDARQTAQAACRKFGYKTKAGLVSLLDSPWFTTVLFKGYAALYKVDHDPRYINIIRNNLDWAWRHARDRYGLLFQDWNAGKREYNTSKWLLDEACIAELYARIAYLEENRSLR